MKLCEVNKLTIWPVRSNYYDFVSSVNSFYGKLSCGYITSVIP